MLLLDIDESTIVLNVKDVKLPHCANALLCIVKMLGFSKTIDFSYAHPEYALSSIAVRPLENEKLVNWQQLANAQLFMQCILELSEYDTDVKLQQSANAWSPTAVKFGPCKLTFFNEYEPQKQLVGTESFNVLNVNDVSSDCIPENAAAFMCAAVNEMLVAYAASSP